MATFTIPLVTLPVGVRTFGPSNAADTETAIVLTIDRTVTGGLNSLTSATTLATEVDQSNDGGSTWQEVAAASTIGGALTDAHGNPVTVFGFTVKLQPGTGRQLRAAVTVAGSAVAVAGTLVTS